MTPKQIDLVQIRKMAANKEKENWRFRQFLKGSEDDLGIDRLVAEITERVWAGIDCTTCANCCRELQPTFSAEDVSRVARRLGMDRQQFINMYLQETEHGESNRWNTRTTPCPFLKGNLLQHLRGPSWGLHRLSPSVQAGFRRAHLEHD
jgi:uncharacterized protein